MENEMYPNGNKFNDESEFYSVLNQWVRDGSNITGFYGFVTDTGFVNGVDLIGPDGAKEELILVVE